MGNNNIIFSYIQDKTKYSLIEYKDKKIWRIQYNNGDANDTEVNITKNRYTNVGEIYNSLYYIKKLWMNLGDCEKYGIDINEEGFKRLKTFLNENYKYLIDIEKKYKNKTVIKKYELDRDKETTHYLHDFNIYNRMHDYMEYVVDFGVTKKIIYVVF